MSFDEEIKNNVDQSIEEVEVTTDSEENQQDDSYDYSLLSKKELLEEAQTIKNYTAVSVSKTRLGELKEAFENIFKDERQAAYESFLESGGEKDGFEYQDQTVKNFFDTLKEVNELKRSHKIKQEDLRKSNTRKKIQLVDRLRELVSGEESTQTFNEIKEIQKTWKETGFVNQAEFYELNANYSALLDRYYSFRSIYFDLKSLDRDKNLELKKAIVEEAKTLLTLENTLEAMRALNDLHTQYKDLGPVPEADSEALWQSFKEVSDQVRDRRTAHIEAFKVQLDANLVAKKALLEKVKAYSEVKVSSVKEWNALTVELTALQEDWKKAGLVPEESKKAVNDEFWASCRVFFANKSEYFLGLDEERKKNHQQKLALIEKVKAIKDSEDFSRTADEIKRLQGLWKNIGSSPRAVHESVYQDFRKECDYFFNRRSEKFEENEKEFEANLEAKNQICAKIEALNSDAGLADFETLIAEYFALGFVPKKAISALQNTFTRVTETYIASLKSVTEDQLQTLQLNLELGAVKGTPNEKDFVYNKTKSLRNKIGGIQDEINTLNTNVEFFANSKSFASIQKEVADKVAVLEADIAKIKVQLKILSISI